MEKLSQPFKTEIDKGPDGGRAGYVKAWPLTYLPGKYVGSSPSENPPGWKNYAQDASDQWIRGHLLSEHLHGPGVAWNLVPIPQKINSQMATPEGEMKNKIKNQGKFFQYETKAYYNDDRTDKNEKAIPTKLTITYGELIKEGNTYSGAGETKTFDNIGLPNFSGKPDFNSVGQTTLRSKGLGGEMAIDIVNCRDSFNQTNGEFTDCDDVINMMDKYYEDKRAIVEKLYETVKSEGLKNKRDIPLSQLGLPLNLTPKEGMSNPYNVPTDESLPKKNFVRSLSSSARKKIKTILGKIKGIPASMDIKPKS